MYVENLIYCGDVCIPYYKGKQKAKHMFISSFVVYLSDLNGFYKGVYFLCS